LTNWREIVGVVRIDYNRYLMEKETVTPTPSGASAPRREDEHHIQFSGFIFEVNAYSDQQVPEY
jgi:hypothetical protein